MAERKTKVTPAAPAEGDAQHTANQGGANDNQEQVLQVAKQAPQESAPGEAVAGLFEPNAIEVVAKCERFRRAGREFTREVSTIRLSELTEGEFKLLYDEPMLAVQLAYIKEA